MFGFYSISFLLSMPNPTQQTGLKVLKLKQSYMEHLTGNHSVHDLKMDTEIRPSVCTVSRIKEHYSEVMGAAEIHDSDG